MPLDVSMNMFQWFGRIIGEKYKQKFMRFQDAACITKHNFS